jgi:hypothetical protein
MYRLPNRGKQAFLGLAAVALSLAPAGAARADSAISAVVFAGKPQHNVTMCGRQGIRFPFTAVIRNAKGVRCEGRIYFYDSASKPLRGVRKGYSDDHGAMCTSGYFTPSSDWKAVAGSAFMPYRAIAVKAGRYELTFVATILSARTGRSVAVPVKGSLTVNIPGKGSPNLAQADRPSQSAERRVREVNRKKGMGD